MRTIQLNKGFSLLELLLVVFILSSLAVVSLNFVDLQDGQQRYDETKQRMETIRSAILGYPTPVYNGEIRLSGFIVDNGKLPTSINELATKPTTWQDSDVFQPNFNTTCVEGASLRKGYRANYLANSLRSEDAQQDAWGQAWQESSDTDSFEFQSFGQGGEDDSMTPSLSGLEKDITRSIGLEHFETQTAGITIEVENRAGSTTPVPVGGYRIAILVYENQDSASVGECPTGSGNSSTWKSIESEPSLLSLPSPCPMSPAENCFNLGSSLLFTFSNTSSDPITSGRHPIVLIDGVTDVLVKTGTGSKNIIGYIDVYPGSLMPNKIRLFKAG